MQLNGSYMNGTLKSAASNGFATIRLSKQDIEKLAENPQRVARKLHDKSLNIWKLKDIVPALDSTEKEDFFKQMASKLLDLSDNEIEKALSPLRYAVKNSLITYAAYDNIVKTVAVETAKEGTYKLALAIDLALEIKERAKREETLEAILLPVAEKPRFLPQVLKAVEKISSETIKDKILGLMLPKTVEKEDYKSAKTITLKMHNTYKKYTALTTLIQSLEATGDHKELKQELEEKRDTL